MTAEQLEELLSAIDGPGNDKAAKAMAALWREAPSLARKVIAADAMQMELEKCEIMLRLRGLTSSADAAGSALTAYREASK